MELLLVLEGANAHGKVPHFFSVMRDSDPSDSSKDMGKVQVLSLSTVGNVDTALEHVHTTTKPTKDTYFTMF
jgi:hypothetical protein